MYKLNLKKGNYPIIISPNLGLPLLINLRDFKNANGEFVKKVVFEALIIAISRQNVEDILTNFHLNIFIQPILKDIGEF